MNVNECSSLSSLFSSFLGSVAVFAESVFPDLQSFVLCVLLLHLTHHFSLLIQHSEIL